MKYFTLIFLFFMFSCGEKDSVQLPLSNVIIVEKVNDLTPVYVFFKIEGKDTIADVNRKNTIISTTWVFNIDKRLPLKLVIPEVMKLQEKKRKDSDYKNELAQNYYTYMDSVKKNLAFISFEKVYYKMEKPSFGVTVYFDKGNKISFNDSIVQQEDIENYLNTLPSDKPNQFMFSFSKDLDFRAYVQDKIFIERLKLEGKSAEEFIY